MIEIFEYDTKRYGFKEWAHSVLGSDNLEALHQHECPGAISPKHRIYVFTTALKGAFHGPIRETFGDFVREYATQRVPFDPWLEIYPNFRVHEPGQHSTSPMHRDRDYLKERGSLKIWLPFTRTAGGGTLWSETEEGKNDLRPWEMSYGEALFFDSLNLLHGCRFNDSPNTRVSMDFIVRRNPRPTQSPVG
jgi:hypothetical protein